MFAISIFCALTYNVYLIPSNNTKIADQAGSQVQVKHKGPLFREGWESHRHDRGREGWEAGGGEYLLDSRCV